jgi:SAM-dependent methyltransferase
VTGAPDIMDADLSHPPSALKGLWDARTRADIVIASRYVEGGRADMPASRYVMSRVLNRAFSRGLSLGVRDMSSGFRLYHRRVLERVNPTAVHFDILQEILITAYAEGWSVCEVPFVYAPRRYGSSHARVLKFGAAYARTFWSLWKLRNSIHCGDYDARAYDSAIFLQRCWRRCRYRHITDLMNGQGRVLDVGCGSSRIIGALPPGSVAMDILMRKLRYARRYDRSLVLASGFQIPFPDASFPCVVCSQVIEHVPKDSGILEELHRVLGPGGRLILGTPDYDRWQWVVTEKLYGLAAPGGYADEHISHYSRDELVALFTSKGYSLEDVRYILSGELIRAFPSPGGVRPGSSGAAGTSHDSGHWPNSSSATDAASATRTTH